MKISTWNLQGNGYNGMCSTVAEAKTRMRNEEIDVFCLQETGFYENEQSEVLFSNNNFTLSRNLVVGTNDRGFKVNRYSLKYGTSNFRCCMAILVRAELDKIQPALIPMGSSRDVFGVLLKNGVAVYNIHAPSGNPEFAKSYFLAALREIDRITTLYNIPNVVLAGDFNNNPFVTNEALQYDSLGLKYHLFIPKDRKNILATQRSGNCLDYCCTNLQGNGVTISNNAGFSDHLQVTFNFEN